MRLLSVAIPSYNSEAYLEKCVASLLPGGDRIEIIIVNDGSKDRTQEIGEELAGKYPGIVKLVNKENGGHGDAVNFGLANAEGLYFKVVDSDDKVDKDSLLEVLKVLEEHSAPDTQLDMVIANYVYDKEGVKHKKVMKYTGMIPQNKVIGWEDVRYVIKGHYLLMHSLIYRTEVLRASGLKLPKHTFYVDNIFAYQPFPYVKKLYYINTNLYMYYIGREDQSVNEKVMISRIDQQLRVNRIMLEQYDLIDGERIPAKKLRKYMYNYLEIITIVSSVLALKSGTEENLEKKRLLWEDIKKTDEHLYKKLRHGIMGTVMNLPGKAGRKFGVFCYQIAQKIVGF
ncbi:MAG: glycosyltransferase family 2 protein, partial [Lachnospiraceae bacterium]|nr:glycosyltransferase family 2 protein [Lachnospiraceae bacterium]